MPQLHSSPFRLTAAPIEKRQTFVALLAAVSIFLPYYVTTCVIVLIALYALCGRQRRSRIISMPHSRLIFAVIGIGAFVSLGYANYTGALVSILLACALVAAFYLRSFMTRRLFDRMMDIACAGGAVVGIIAIVQKLSGSAPVRLYVVFDNPNYFATVMEIVALIAVYRLLGNPRKSSFYFTAAVLAGFGIYLSGSLSALVVGTIGVAFYLILRGHIKASVWVIASISCFMLLSTGALSQLLELLGCAPLNDTLVNNAAVQNAKCTAVQMLTIRPAEEINGSIANRFSIWKTALLAIPEHLLFGQGPNTYAMIYSRYLGYASSHTHNLILEALLNYGIVGGGMIAFFALKQFGAAVRKVREHKSTTTNLMLVVLCIMMTLHGMTDVTLLWPQTGLLFLLVFSSSGIRTVPQPRSFVLRAPEFSPNPEFKRHLL